MRVTRSAGTSSPSGVAIFSIDNPEGVTVSQASVAALPVGTAFRLYVEALGIPGQVGSVRSGLAIRDTSSSANTITLELTSLDGTTVGTSQELQLPPSGHISKFIDELFSLPDNFSGVLRVTSTSEIAIVGLRGRTNERFEFLLTTTPPANEADLSTTADKFFAQIADSEGWTTQFVLFSGREGQASSGTLQILDQTGNDLSLALQDVTLPVSRNVTVTILAPGSDSAFNTGTSITFSGSVADADGITALIWTSDRDGGIGTGSTFTRSDLSVGTHTITLTATGRGRVDGHGQHYDYGGRFD